MKKYQSKLLTTVMIGALLLSAPFPSYANPSDMPEETTIVEETTNPKETPSPVEPTNPEEINYEEADDNDSAIEELITVDTSTADVTADVTGDDTPAVEVPSGLVYSEFTTDAPPADSLLSGSTSTYADTYSEPLADTQSTTLAATIVINGNSFDKFSRTKQDIANEFEKSFLGYYTFNPKDEKTWYDTAPSFSAPYNAGKLSKEAHQYMTNRANYFRWLTGVEKLTTPSSYGTEIAKSYQAQAFVRNYYRSHYVSMNQMPEGMDETLWRAGVTDYIPSEYVHSSLAFASGPERCFNQWINEGYLPTSGGGWRYYEIGHRISVLNPSYTSIQFGLSGSTAACGSAKGGTYLQVPFAAFPAPGAMPSEAITVGTSAWCVFPRSDYFEMKNPENAVVKITNLDTGWTGTRSYKDGLLNGGLGCVYFLGATDAYDANKPNYDNRYKVELSGFQDPKTGNPVLITYTVDFFSLNTMVKSPLSRIQAKQHSVTLPYEYNTEEKISQILELVPREAIARNTLDVDYSFEMKSSWKIDSKNNRLICSPSSSELPANTPNIYKLPTTVTMSYYQSSEYASADNLTIAPAKAKSGQNVTFTLKNMLMMLDVKKPNIRLYRTERDTSGRITKKDLVVDSAVTPNAFTYENGYYKYTLKNVTSKNAGEYIAVLTDGYTFGSAQITSFKTLFVDGKTNTQYTELRKVYYKTHVQTYGWQNEVADGKSSGTMGESKRLEAITIDSEIPGVSVRYTTHCQTYGWLPWSRDGEINGTEGEGKRLEAIMISLTGENASKYDVYYRVHAQSYGWLGWAKNGAPSGTAGSSKRLEAIQILIVKRGTSVSDNYNGINTTGKAAYINANGSKFPSAGIVTPPNISYRTHVQTYGWQGWKYNGAMSGTSGQSKRLEGIRIRLTDVGEAGGVTYRTHVQTFGWQDWKNDGEMSGTSGLGKRLEAIEIKLTGPIADEYDVYYRVHAQSFGWLDWAKNGEPAGTAGYSKRLEGIEIVLVKKGKPAPGPTNKPYVKR